MLFTPHIKRKKSAQPKELTKPFPTVEDGLKVCGTFTGISVEISEAADIIRLYEEGCYGKGNTSRSAPQLVTHGRDDSGEERLVLALEEAFFLAYFLEVLRVLHINGEELGWLQFLKEAQETNSLFIESLAAYLHLKSNNWIVKSGIKFGGTFLAYKKGPRYNHASFIVFVSNSASTSQLIQKDLKGLQRIAETSDKDVLLLEVTKPLELEIQSLADLKLIEISEIIVRRFNYTSFVQQKTK